MAGSYYKKRLIESEIKTLTHLVEGFKSELLAATLADNFSEVKVLGRILNESERRLELLKAKFRLEVQS